MTVRGTFAASCALAFVLLFAACGGGAVLPAETDEALFGQGISLKKQGRNPEALVSFLKLIDQRGPQLAPESHLEAGLIYLLHVKDYFAAIYHFKRYLELQPNSREAPLVRDRISQAMREIARTLPGRLLEDQSVRLEANQEIEDLRRENRELRAEVATLRGGAARAMPRSRTVSITIPEAPRPPPAAAESSFMMAAPPTGAVERTLPPSAPPAGAARPAAPTAGGLKHTVRPGDTLFGIARRYEPVNTSRKVREIFEANRDVMQDINKLPPVGTELKIP